MRQLARQICILSLCITLIWVPTAQACDDLLAQFKTQPYWVEAVAKMEAKGKAVEAVVERLDRLQAQIQQLPSGLAMRNADLVNAAAIRGQTISDLIELGLSKKAAKKTVDLIIGGKSARIGVLAWLSVTEVAVRDKANFLGRPLVKAGWPKPVAAAIALTSAVLMVTPVSITTLGAATGVIGPWGALPGLGLVEGTLLFTSSLYGAKGVSMVKKILRLRKQLETKEGEIDVPELDLRDTDAFARHPKWTMFVARRIAPDWNRYRAEIFPYILMTAYLLVGREGTTSHARVIHNAVKVTQELDQATVREIWQDSPTQNSTIDL